MNNKNMTMGTENGGCLSREALRTLATQFLESAGAPEEGSPDYLPVDLFVHDRAGLRQHLEICPACRKKLLEELCSVQRYLEGLNNPANVERFNTITSQLKQRDDDMKAKSEIVETILYYDAYDQGEDKIALAAASASNDTQPLRFSSEDGTMILRQLPGTEAEKAKYQLIADDQSLTANAEVIIGKQSLRTSSEGLLDLDGIELEITRETTIIIRSQRN